MPTRPVNYHEPTGSAPEGDRVLVIEHHDGWKTAQQVVNLTLSATAALDALRRVAAGHTEMCQCNPCRVVPRLARDLKAME